MRLIDADALLNALNTYSDTENGNGHFLHGIKSAQEQIDDAPTIDAVSVVHGEWVEAKSGCMSVYPPGQVMCSVCKQRMPSQWKKMPPYCYGCGAKME